MGGGGGVLQALPGIEFQGGGDLKQIALRGGGVWICSGTTHFNNCLPRRCLTVERKTCLP